jgi:hypothetical protein
MFYGSHTDYILSYKIIQECAFLGFISTLGLLGSMTSTIFVSITAAGMFLFIKFAAFQCIFYEAFKSKTRRMRW